MQGTRYVIEEGLATCQGPCHTFQEVNERGICPNCEELMSYCDDWYYDYVDVDEFEDLFCCLSCSKVIDGDEAGDGFICAACRQAQYELPDCEFFDELARRSPHDDPWIEEEFRRLGL